ncbi:kinocilin [Aquarana catesbeiana]|uniref:kinocilin n=1 Tax=Aquarana catesbeiana TaxID=8400 RepID=UPI003CC92380
MDERHSLQVLSALIGIVAGSIIVGVSNSSGAATVGGIFLGAAGFGLLVSIMPLLQVWHCSLPGRFQVQPLPPASNQEIITEPQKGDNVENEKKDLPPGQADGPSSTQDSTPI